MGKLMKTVKSYQIKKIGNPRYREMKINEKYFLVDLDANPFFWYLPGVAGLFPMRVQELDGTIEESPKKRYSPAVSVGVTTPIMTMIIFRFFPKMILSSNPTILLGIVLAIQVILFVIKCILSSFNKISMGEYHYISIKYNHLFSFYKQVLPAMIGFILFYIWCVLTFIKTGTLLGMVIVTMMNVLILSFHNLMHFPQEAKSYAITK